MIGVRSLWIATALVFANAGCPGVRAVDSGLSDACSEGCAIGQVCQSGQCVSPCAAAGGTVCGAFCVNLSNNNANCGACGVACASGLVCSANGCASTCAPGYSMCATNAGPRPYCANLAADIYNCGTCDTACVPGDFCLAGICSAAPMSCPAGQTLCATDAGSPTCSDLQSDTANCGACGHSCGAGNGCLGGTCQSTACSSGFMTCPLGDGGTTCLDTTLDPNNCGGCAQSCGADGICRDGACSCPGFFTQCATASSVYCTHTTVDRNNCGACGHICLKCESCEIGQCTAQNFFTSSVTVPNIPTLFNGPILADLNLDGYPDLAINGYGPSSLIAILNGGDGGFQPPTTIYPIGDSMTSYGTGIVAGDFNGDGLPDLAVGLIQSDFSTKAAVYFGLGDAGFYLPDGGLWVAGPFPISASSYYDNIWGLVAGDFNGDGRQDFVVLGEETGLTVFYQVAGGFMQSPIETGVDAGYYFRGTLATGDLNADGRTDLIVGFSLGTPSVVALIAVSGGFVSVPVSVPASSNYEGPAMAVSSDGLLHVVADELRTFRYAADAGFVEVGEYPLPDHFAPYGYAPAATATDLNGDGQSDLVASSYSGVAVWLRNDGGYDYPFGVPISHYYIGMAVGAVNGDSLPDFIFANYSDATVLKNNSDKCSP